MAFLFAITSDDSVKLSGLKNSQVLPLIVLTPIIY